MLQQALHPFIVYQAYTLTAVSDIGYHYSFVLWKGTVIPGTKSMNLCLVNNEWLVAIRFEESEDPLIILGV